MITKRMSRVTQLVLAFCLCGLLLVSLFQSKPVVAQGSDLDAILARATVKGYLISLKRAGSGPSALTEFYLTAEAAASNVAQSLQANAVDSFDITSEARLADGQYQITASISPSEQTVVADVGKISNRWQITHLVLQGGEPTQAPAMEQPNTETTESPETSGETSTEQIDSDEESVDEVTEATDAAAMASEKADGTMNSDKPVAEIISAGLNVRAEPDINAAIIVQLKQGDVVDVIDINPDRTWFKVALEGQTIGWMSAKSTYVAASDAARNVGLPTDTEAMSDSTTDDKETADEMNTASDGNTTADSMMATVGKTSATAEVVSFALNVREGPGFEFPVIARLSQGDIVEVVDANNAARRWIQVARNGEVIGWASGKPAYVTISEGTIVNDQTSASMSDSVTKPDAPQEDAAGINQASASGTDAVAEVLSFALNVRAGPGFDYPIITQLSQGDLVKIVGANNASRRWIEVARNEQTIGWISGKADYVSTSGDLENVPVVPAPPVPEVSVNRAANPAAIPAQPVINSGGNNLIVQERSGGNFYLVNAARTDLHFISTGIDPTISPDGRQIAFTRWGVGGDGSVWIYDLTTGSERQITKGIFEPKSPTWSPDGMKIVVSFQDGGRRDVEQKCQDRRQEIPDGAFDFNVGSDSGRICFKLAPDRQWRLRSVIVADGTLEDLSSEVYSFAPTWDPVNAWRIIFASSNGLQQLDVNRNVHFPFTSDLRDRAPVFSPDGSKVAVTYKQHNHWEVYTVSTADGGRARLTPLSILDDEFNSAAPAWSPDSSQIAFITDRNEGRWEFWIMNADGSNPRPLLSPSAAAKISPEYHGVDERLIAWGR